jgi:hypothetical protein
MTIRAVVVVLPEDCRSGSCDCERASQCKFKRCANCDDLVTAEGKWIDDNEWHGEHTTPCPDCGAPLSPP